jgi:hypothetical protein
VTFPFDSIPFVQARHWTWISPSAPRFVNMLVTHSMEAPNKPTTASSVAGWFASSGAPQASPHVCIDQSHVIGCVEPQHMAWACGVANWEAYSIELAGYARETQSEWLAEPNLSMLRRAADHMAKAAAFFGLPLVVLDEELTAALIRDSLIRQKKIAGTLSGLLGGVTTHAMANHAWRNGDLYGLPAAFAHGDLSHTDPGDGFPLAELVTLMQPAPIEPLAVPEEYPLT